MKYRFFIKRYEDTSDIRIIGFDVIHELGHKKYFETTIPLVDCFHKSEASVCNMAYQKLRLRILQEMEEIAKEPLIVIGTEFIPPDD